MAASEAYKPKPKLYTAPGRRFAVLGGVVVAHVLAFWLLVHLGTITIPSFAPMMVTVEAAPPADAAPAPAHIEVPRVAITPPAKAVKPSPG
jgi:hypothetical protein